MNKRINIPGRKTRHQVLMALDAIGVENAKTILKEFSESIGLAIDDRNYVSSYLRGVEQVNCASIGEFLEAAILLRSLRPPVEMRLNDEYAASVTKDEVTVGCQTFNADIVLQLADKIRELRK